MFINSNASIRTVILTSALQSDLWAARAGGYMHRRVRGLHAEGIIKTLLENEGNWVRQSFKVNLTKQEKRDNLRKHSIPRPRSQIFWPLNYKVDQVIAFEAKSYLDSLGVKT